MTRPAIPAGWAKFLSINRMYSLSFMLEIEIRVSCLLAKFKSYFSMMNGVVIASTDSLTENNLFNLDEINP